jgi:DNA-binding PadR family transcriptional regulator
MNQNELLLLGLLVAQSQHGYQINEFIERELSHVTDMKKGNAYATLERLCKEGFVSVRIEQEGNRPQRKVYSITSAGQTQFYTLLRYNLSNSERMIFAGDVGLMLMDHLPIAEVVECLKERLVQATKKLQVHAEIPDHGHGIGVDLAVKHLDAMLKADVAWLEANIPLLEQQALNVQN